MSNPTCFELAQESENSLAIKIREQVLDKLASCQSEEELKKTIVSILSQNSEQLDIDKIQNGNETLSRLENFLACSLTEPQDNLNQTQIEVGNLLRNAIDLVCNPPALTIPYPYPIVDISGDFLNKLLLAILKLAINIILSILKKLLSFIIDICNSGLSNVNGYGITNIADIIKSSVGEAQADSFINDVFNAFGINTDGTAATIIQEDICSDIQTVSNGTKNIYQLLDDVSFMLTPVEVCSLLNKKANNQTLELVEELINFEYPQLKVSLNNRNKLVSFFGLLGTKNDPSICDLIEQNSQKILSNPELCFSEDVDSLRKDLLSKKGLTEEEIKQQLDKERQKTKDNLQKISELAAIVKTDPNKLFGENNFFCKNGSAGLLTLKDMPSLQKNLDDVLNVTYNSFADVYRNSAASFSTSVISVEKKAVQNPRVLKKFIDTTFIDEDGNTNIIENSLNTKFMQNISTGQFIICDSNGRFDKQFVISQYEDAEVNGSKIYSNNVLDIQSLVSVTSIESLSGTDNVYILNLEANQKVMSDLVEDLFPNIEDFLNINENNFTISLKIPNKYKPLNGKNESSDFKTVESEDEIIFKTIVGEN